MKKGTLFIVSAPPGAGKTSLTNFITQSLKKDFNLSKIITYTTRHPRNDEVPGVDYHFVTLTEFEQKKNSGFFLETNEYNGNFYGSPRSIINDLEQGKSFFLVVDRSGAKNIKILIENPTLIWLTVPSIQTLQKRMEKRCSETQLDLRARLSLAQKEMLDEASDPAFTYHVCNDNFEQAAHEIINIIKKELTSTR
jgi:guanylate kinase